MTAAQTERGRGLRLGYDLHGRMATTRDGNTSVGYTYRADGLMASRAKSIYVQLFGNWVVIMEQPKFYLHDGGEPVLEMDLGTNYSTLVATNVRGPDGLVARRQGGSWVYYEFDAQGSVSQRLDSNGNVLSSSVYDAYGGETNSGTPSDPFGYNAQWGYWLDRDTGLYLCQARWYDPVTARWVTRDPIGYSGGANLYGYCGGGPVGWADPSGEIPLLLAVVVVAVLITTPAIAPTSPSDLEPAALQQYLSDCEQGNLEIAESIVDLAGLPGLIKGGIRRAIKESGEEVFQHAPHEARSTYRQRHWRERAKDPQAGAKYGEQNVERMKRGRAPLVKYRNGTEGHVPEVVESPCGIALAPPFYTAHSAISASKAERSIQRWR